MLVTEQYLRTLLHSGQRLFPGLGMGVAGTVSCISTYSSMILFISKGSVMFSDKDMSMKAEKSCKVRLSNSFMFFISAFKKLNLRPSTFSIYSFEVDYLSAGFIQRNNRAYYEIDIFQPINAL